MKKGNFCFLVTCFLVCAGAVNGNIHYVNNFDNYSNGVFLTQATSPVPEWIIYGQAGDCERPMITDTRSFSGSKSLCNANDPQSSTNETSCMMQAYSPLVQSGHDITVSFMFYRTAEQGNPYWNKIRLDVYDTAGKRFAVAAYNGRMYDENTDYNIVENVTTGAWWKLWLILTWNEGSQSYGNTATLNIYRSDGSLFATAYPTVQSGNLSNVEKLIVSMPSGGSGTPLTRPTSFIDDFNVWEATLKNPDFGKLWVRNRDFTVTALVVDSNYLDIYEDAGMNKLLGWENRESIYEEAENYGIPWFLHSIHKINIHDPNNTPSVISTLMGQMQASSADLIDTYFGCEAQMVWDEGKPDEMNYVADSVAWALVNYPEHLVFTNLNAYDTYAVRGYDYSDHVSDVIDTGVDVIGADAYPYGSDGGYITNRYFATYESIRARALAAGIPYWCFVQATDEGDCYLPSESDLRMTIFVPLAYGVTGLQYYYYWHPQSHNVIAANGNYDTFSGYVEDATAEVKYFGRSLRYLTSKAVRYVRSQSSNALPTGMTLFEGTPSTPFRRIKSITIDTAGTTNNGVVGFFDDDNSHEYFMLVNVKRAAGASAASQSLNFTINFDSSVTSLYKMNRETGAIESVTITNGSIAPSILGGTGELYKINSSSFVGL